MRILFLSSGSRVPSARFRIMPYVDRFRAEGHRVVLAHSFPQKYDYFPWMGFRPSQLLKRSVRWWHWLQAKMRRFDLVYIDREIFDDETWEMEARFKEACGRLVIDLCDAIFLRYPTKFDELMKLADLVVCGNPYLLSKVASMGAAAVHVPEAVDTDVYRPKVHRLDGDCRPVIGWMGSSGNLRYFAVAAEALRNLARIHDFELRIVAPNREPLKEIDLSGVSWTHEPWDPKREVQQVQQFDIGVMPLFRDEEWDVYKSGLKLIQYLAIGIPGVATPVGVNRDILDGAPCGMAVESTEDWYDALDRLLEDRELRQEMGKAGRKLAVEKYSVGANYPIMRDALAGMIERTR